MKKATLAALNLLPWCVLSLFYLLSCPPSAIPSGVVVLIATFWASLFLPFPLAHRLTDRFRQRRGVVRDAYEPAWFVAPLSWPPLLAATLALGVMFPPCVWHAVAAHEADPITSAWVSVVLLLATVTVWMTLPDMALTVLVARRTRRARRSEPGWRADGERGWSPRSAQRRERERQWRPRRVSAHDAALLNAETIHIRPDGRS